jgi:hypothetical protein
MLGPTSHKTRDDSSKSEKALIDVAGFTSLKRALQDSKTCSCERYAETALALL